MFIPWQKGFRVTPPTEPQPASLSDTTAHTAPPRDFQTLIMTLNHYWAPLGCALMQPLDMEVGAGTFHPATFLRAVGPEPWRAAYVQPSRRPTDGAGNGNWWHGRQEFFAQSVKCPSVALLLRDLSECMPYM